jgi:hypothetical protein
MLVMRQSVPWPADYDSKSAARGMRTGTSSKAFAYSRQRRQEREDVASMIA